MTPKVYTKAEKKKLLTWFCQKAHIVRCYCNMCKDNTHQVVKSQWQANVWTCLRCLKDIVIA